MSEWTMLRQASAEVGAVVAAVVAIALLEAEGGGGGGGHAGFLGGIPSLEHDLRG